MNIIIGDGPRSGKTTAVIRMASEKDAYIVVYDMQEAHNVVWQAGVLGTSIRHPITMRELIDTQKHTRQGFPLIIDNADNILSQLFAPHTILACSLTRTLE